MVSEGNRRIAKNTIFLYLRMGVVFLVSFFTTRVVMQTLGETSYGIYTAVGGFVSMFGILNITLASGVNRFYNEALGQNDSERLRKVFNVSFRIQLLEDLVVLVLLEAVGVWFINQKMTLPSSQLTTANWLFQFATVSLLLNVLQVPYNAAVFAHERMDFFAVVSVLDAFLRLAIALSLPYVGGDRLFGYGLLIALISVGDFLMYFCYCRVKFKALRLERGTDKPLFKRMLGFSGWTLLDPFAYMFRDQGCNMVLNYYHGPSANAAYGVSAQVGNAFNQFASNLSLSFKPQLMQSYAQGAWDRTKRLLYSMSKLNFAMQLMICVPLCLEMDYLLHLWLGDSVPQFAVPFTMLLLIVKTLNTLNAPLTTVVMATGNVKRYMICSSAIVFSVFLAAIALMALGQSPVTIYEAMLVATIVNQVVCVAITRRVFKAFDLAEYLAKVIGPCGLQVLLVLVVPVLEILFLPVSFWRLLLVCATSVVCSALAAYFVTLDNAERQQALELVNKKIKK